MILRTFYSQDCTPLLLAATYNHGELFTVLRAAGADMFARDSRQQSILHHTCQVATSITHSVCRKAIGSLASTFLAQLMKNVRKLWFRAGMLTETTPSI